LLFIKIKIGGQDKCSSAGNKLTPKFEEQLCHPTTTTTTTATTIATETQLKAPSQ